MKIINYKPEYREQLADMVNDFNEYIVSLDKTGICKSFESRDDLMKYTDKCIEDSIKMNGYLYLACIDERPVGFIQGIIMSSKSDLMYSLTHQSGKHGWIGELFVCENNRGMGIGKKLISQARKHFESNNCDLLCLKAFWQNKNAIGIYEKLGMNISEVEMEMKL